MLNLLGSKRQLCDGLTRRELLQIGSLGAWGVTLANVSNAWAAPMGQGPQFGRAKRCLLVYLFGGAPQHETFDPKPAAAVEIQGEMKAICTSLPGVEYGEGLPQTAKIADRLTTIRSMTHPYPLHGAAYALSGLPVYTTDLETRPWDSRQWPFFGSIADYYWTQQSAEPRPLLQHVGLPWQFNSQVDDLGLIAGPYAQYLGQQYDPLWAKWQGEGLRTAPKCRHEQTKEYSDPYAQVNASGTFHFEGVTRPEGAGAEQAQARLQSRQLLLADFDAMRRQLDQSSSVAAYGQQQQQALSLLTSEAARNAVDVSRETTAARESYGLTLFGQSCLAARRLLEAGTRFVTLFWDAYGTYFSGGWDTHQNHYPRLKQYLLPGFDTAFAALILDLEQRGLLDDTLVICTTEHGRTPQIDSGPAGAARHHWSNVYSTVMAGGGMPRGKVVGASDKQGGEVLDTPISPKDMQATALHLLGIPADWRMPDRQQRPVAPAGDGQVRPELLA